MSVTVSYTLNISPSAEERHAQSSKDNSTEASLSFDLPSPDSKRNYESISSESYYHGLSSAIKAAIEEVGDRLTEWRDAVGDEEKVKEKAVASLVKARKAKGDESDDEETI